MCFVDEWTGDSCKTAFYDFPSSVCIREGRGGVLSVVYTRAADGGGLGGVARGAFLLGSDACVRK